MFDQYTDRSAEMSTGREQHCLSRYGLMAALIAGVVFSLPAEAKLYKWVDDNGVTHYSETVPPRYAGKDRVELNKSGREVKTTEAMTPERRAQQEAEEARQKEADKAAEEQKRQDRTLLATYSSVNEIELARKRNLAQVDARINSLNSLIKASQINMDDLQKEAEGYTKRSKPVPDSLSADLKLTQRRLDKLNKDLEQPQSQMDAINAKYDAYKKRYTELTGKSE